MPQKIELSIIIVNFNTAQITLNCLRSIKKYPPEASFETIVVDNGSTDNSVKLIKKAGFQVIENSQNLGFAHANNQGIKKAKGKYMLLLNSDTLVTKGALNKLLEFAKTKNNLGAVVPTLRNADDSLQPSVFKFPTIARAVKQYWLGSSYDLDKYAPKGSEPSKIESAVMAAFLITPEALQKVGMLDEKYFMFYEDFAYCRELKKKGLDLYYLPEAVVVHLHGASGKNLAESKEQWKRLIPSSKIYHGVLKHYLYNLILWSGQKGQTIKQHFF